MVFAERYCLLNFCVLALEVKKGHEEGRVALR